MTLHQNCPTIYFAKVPAEVELCSVSLTVCSDSPGISNIAQFGSQPQIIKCRELIFTEPNVLASPSLQEQGLIFVIIQKSFWKTGKLQMRCQKSGLKIGKPGRVIPAVFQACLSYTLKAKLAPLWNKAGELYIQGRDFLVSSAKANAMGVEVNVTDAEICLALKPTLIKLPHSDIRDFEISSGVLEHFFCSNDHSIPEYAIEDKWCHILPSLKKGKVVSITHDIPPVSPFRTYKDIRRYWKNAYGYRLPESDVGVIYYNVYFPAIGNTLFTYPDFCIFKRGPVLLPRVDPMTIIPSFLADLKSKVPNICGFPFKVNPKAQYPTTGLYQASIQNNSLSNLTLSTMPPSFPKRIPLPNHVNQPGSPHTPQRRVMPPNRALAKAFDAAFKQAHSVNQPASYSSQPQRQQHSFPLSSAQTQSVGASIGSHMHRPVLMQSPVPAHTPVAQQLTQSQLNSPAAAHTPVTQQLMPSQLSSPFQTHTPVAQHLMQSQLNSPVPTHSHTPVAQHSMQSQLSSPFQTHTPQHGGYTPTHYQSRPQTHLMGSPVAVHTPVNYQSNTQCEANIGSPPAVHTPVHCQSTYMMQQSPVGVAVHNQSTVMSHPHTPATYPSPAAGMLNSPCPSYHTINSPPTHHPSPYHQSHHSTILLTQSTFQVPTSPAPPRMLTPVPQESPMPSCAKVVPNFRPHKPRNISTLPQTSQLAKVIPSFKPAAKRSITPSFATKLQLDAEPQQDVTASPIPTQPMAKPALKPTFGTSKATSNAPKFGGHTPSNTKHGDMAGSLSKTKRKAKDDGSEPTAKKPRSKPKVQEGVDMQALLVNDQLSKVNTATLIAWLKDKNIKVKSREKKTDLVAKVMDYINVKTKEH